jgi:hypothetical protein
VTAIVISITTARPSSSTATANNPAVDQVELIGRPSLWRPFLFVASLVETADLYAAKHEGRDRLVMSGQVVLRLPLSSAAR